MRNRSVLLLFIIIFLASCTKKELITIDIDGKRKHVTLTLEDKHLKHPFQIAFDDSANTGNIYFETTNGKTWVHGKPVSVQNSETSFTGVWNMEEREVEVSITKEANRYLISFYATPDNDILGWGFHIKASQEEYFTGLFERVVDGNQSESWKEGIETAMNLRGEEIDMMIKPTLSLYSPFYLSSNGYGLFIEGSWPGHYDLCKENPNLVKIGFEGNSLRGILYTSSKPSEIVKAHSVHVGPTIIPPKWAFSPYRWRDNNANNEKYYDGTLVRAPFNSMLVEDILMMKALDIPCGVYWIDRPWAEGPVGYNDFTWDKQRFPNHQKMISWLNEQDIQLLLWIAPWVDGNMADTARKRGYTIPKKANEWAMENEFALMDFTKEEAKEWWQNEGLAKVLNEGIKGFKLDRSEELVPETRDVLFANGKTAREMRNDYPVHYVKATHEICKKIHGDDFVLFPRAGYTGSSRYSVFWGGDIGSPPEGLRAAIIAAQRSAIIGYPLWGSDIGGYWHGPMHRDVTARWLAFGCFNPIMEFGPTRNRGPWDMATEPSYDTALIATWRMYAKIHEHMIDYSHKLAVEANATGMPPVRPLFLEYPEQEKAWDDWQTFTYGPDILVSAIWQQNKTRHTCYLPAGVNWIDAWDRSKIYDGGQEIEVDCPFHKIPIFIREGAEINLGDLNELYESSYRLASQKPDLRQLEKEFFR